MASIGISQVMDRNSKPPADARNRADLRRAAQHQPGRPDRRRDAVAAGVAEGQGAAAARSRSWKTCEGRRPRAAIIEGEPILDGKLLAPGQIADPITSIPKGMRLKTISVDAEKSAAGLLEPWRSRRRAVVRQARRAQRHRHRPRSKVILQNIRVFAVDQTVQRSPDGGDERTIAKTISLLLTPEQASKLTLAENFGEVSLIPRNPDDEESADMAEYSTDDLLSDGGKNSREKEQGRDEARVEKPKDNGGLLSAIQQYVPPPKPPFRHGNRRGPGRPRSDSSTPTPASRSAIREPADARPIADERQLAARQAVDGAASGSTSTTTTRANANANELLDRISRSTSTTRSDYADSVI